MASPRVLTIKFELHVPEGLRANIRGKRLDAAIAKMTGAMQALTSNVFPWADHMVVSTEWSYRWWSDVENVVLPKTAENTVEKPTTPEEEAAIVAAESNDV